MDICYGKLIHFCDQMVSELDRIAMDCLEKLRGQHPDHPALTSPIIPPSTPLKESRWAQDRCYQLFKCINHVLFSQVCTELHFVNCYMIKTKCICLPAQELNLWPSGCTYPSLTLLYSTSLLPGGLIPKLVTLSATETFGTVWRDQQHWACRYTITLIFGATLKFHMAF